MCVCVCMYMRNFEVEWRRVYDFWDDLNARLGDRLLLLLF